MGINVVKNRNRDPFSFANINLLGKCNCSCFFCLGEDIHNELEGQNQLAVHFGEWKNFNHFLKKCQDNNVKKLYITGQNTDSLMYHYLEELIDYLHYHNFDVGLRTNGYLAEKKMSIINKTDLSVGYSIHSLHPVTTNMIVGRSDMPRWDYILRFTLEMWSEVAAQGYDPEFVHAFTFEPARLTQREKNARLKPFAIDPWVDNHTKKLKQYNTIILKDGRRETLNPPILAPEQRV